MTHMLVHKNLVTQFPGNLIGEPVVVKHAVVVVVGIIIISIIIGIIIVNVIIVIIIVIMPVVGTVLEGPGVCS